MKNSQKKSISQLKASNQPVLTSKNLSKITGGNDGDKTDEYIGMQDVIDG